MTHFRTSKRRDSAWPVGFSAPTIPKYSVLSLWTLRIDEPAMYARSHDLILGFVVAHFACGTISVTLDNGDEIGVHSLNDSGATFKEIAQLIRSTYL